MALETVPTSGETSLVPEGNGERNLMALSEGDGRMDAVQQKVNEYRFLVAPVEQAITEMERARRMLRARAEDEIQELSPVLAALSETLDISTLELLTARDRAAFLRDAVARSGVSLDMLARRIMEAGAGAREQLEALGLPESRSAQDTSQFVATSEEDRAV